MPEMVKDPVFGEMEYKHRWVKKEKLMLLGKEREIKIIAAAYTGDEICDAQRNACMRFRREQEEIERKLPELIADYYEKNRAVIEEHYRAPEEGTDPTALVKPVSLLFDRNGRAVILCDTDWDQESGIGIELFPEVKVDIQEVFL